MNKCERQECNISFAHSDCKEVKSDIDGRFLGHVFRDTDGNWTYVDATRPGLRGHAQMSGTTSSKQSAINWLKLGDRR